MSLRKENSKYKHHFLFDNLNWRFVGIGLALMVLGYILMMGGKTDDPNVFNPDQLYSFVRITLAPILVLLGLGMQIYAILQKPKAKAKQEEIVELEKEQTAEDQPQATTKKLSGMTGKKCKLSGVYACRQHSNNTIPLSKNEKFPPCSLNGGHKATWDLKYEA